MIAGSERESVTALERGFAVLHCFGAGTAGLTHVEIARATALPKATVSRITHSLVKLGYLDHADHDGRFRLTAKNLRLGSAYLASVDVRTVARPMMTQLAQQTRTTVNLAVREGSELVVVETVRSDDAVVSVNSRIGSQFPILQTAMGRAYLAGLPEAERAAALESLRSTLPAQDWKTLEKRVRKGIADCEAFGFCCLTGEWRRGVNSVAAPIRRSGAGQPVHVINCAGPELHLPETSMARQVGPQLLAICNSIRESLSSTWTST